MDDNKLKESRLKLVSDSNYINAFRQNLRIYDIPLRELAEAADISYDTLKSFIYGDSQDCKLSMAVKLAKVLGCSIDELIGTNTLTKDAKDCLAMLNVMPPQFTKFIKWAVNNNYIRRNTHPLNKCISVMEAKFDDHLIATTLIKTTIVNAPEEIIIKTFLGIRIPCDEFIPYYYKDDIIFLANDRKPKSHEHIIVGYKSGFWIVEKKKDKYITLNGGIISDDAWYIGYVAHVERQ